MAFCPFTIPTTPSFAKIFALAAAAIGVVASGAPAQTPLLTLSPVGTPVEDEDVDVNVSGVFVAGVMFLGGVSAAERPSLSAEVPASWAGNDICVEANSLDGVYASTYRYAIEEEALLDNGEPFQGGLVVFSYPTRFQELVGGAPGEDFGVRVSRGDCASVREEFLVSSWNRDVTEAPQKVMLQLNSLGADRLAIFLGDDPHAPAIECDPTEAGRARAFDRVCEIPLSMIPSFPIDVEIMAVRAGVRDPARRITLVAQ
ncbi:MAG: hypothetical protein AAF899_02020 [Pseudomonadota bacterium]